LKGGGTLYAGKLRKGGTRKKESRVTLIKIGAMTRYRRSHYGPIQGDDGALWKSVPEWSETVWKKKKKKRFSF